MTDRILKHNAQQGFSLVEMSVVIAIMAVMATFGLDATATFMQRAAHESTHEELDEIKIAIDRFVREESRLPCPADPTVNHMAASFGGEACGTGGVVSYNSGGRAIYFGTVPIRALNLPLGYMADGWERKYTYAVSQDLTTGLGYANPANVGEIMVLSGGRDGTNNYHITEPAGTAAWVVVSHGMNGFGAYPFRGTGVESDCGGGTAYNDSPNEDNCDHTPGGNPTDAVFFDTNYNVGEVEAFYFDDIVRWDVKR